MARVHFVAKARKDQGVCDSCGHKLLAGSPYKWVGLRPSGPGSHLKKKRCANCPPWRQSELSFSKMSGIYAAMESWDDFLASDFESSGEVEAALQDVADQIRSVAEEYRESAENMEEGFGHPTYMSDELNEKADSLESWADDIEGADVPETPVEDDPETWDIYAPSDDEEWESWDEDERAENFQQAMDNWRDEVQQISEPGDCPV